MGQANPVEMQDELADTFCRTDPAYARVFARTTFLADNRHDLSLIPVPTLVIDCAQDAIAPREVGTYVNAHVPDSRLITLDAIGHCPHVSAPDATADAIAEFARST
jgi:sigma-B regulation protein RsbQ